LHNFVYLVAILALHYLWSVKIVSPQPIIYALLARCFWHGVTRSSASGGANPVMCGFPQIFYQPRLFFDSG
jgi:hypothetical protein